MSLGALGALALAAPAHAAAQLDQSSIPNGPYFSAQGTGLKAGQIDVQSFTAGLKGRLEKIDLALNRWGQAESSVSFSLQRLSGETLFSTQISTSSLSEVAWDAWYSSPIDLSSANILVNQGDQFRLVLTGAPQSTPGAIGWFYMTNGTPFSYAGGNASIDGHAFNWDYGFRTYVNSAVPEPAAWALMIVGFGGAGMALRRSRRPLVASC